MSEILFSDEGGDTMHMVKVDNFITPRFPNEEATEYEMFKQAPQFTFREDDIMLCTFPKTGTNWIFEVIMMALNKSAQRISFSKVESMLEARIKHQVDKLPSPRVVNCHYPLRFLPQEGMKKKKIKTVLCVRNPKDTAVSYYNHMKGIKTYDYSGEWKNWIRPYMQGKFEYGKYADYLNEWQELIGLGPEFPLHVVYYEDLKKMFTKHGFSRKKIQTPLFAVCRVEELQTNGEKELKRLLDFLDISLNDQLKSDIMDACSFEKMKTEKFSKKIIETFLKNDFMFFRKGQVGDWKNWFTVSQDEMFQKMWDTDIRKDTIFEFEYV